jgi:hypothetical protein
MPQEVYSLFLAQTASSLVIEDTPSKRGKEA